MKLLYQWLVDADRRLMAKRKTRGYFTIECASDSSRLVIQADEPSQTEIQAVRAAQAELEWSQNVDGFRQALQILEPLTDGVFLVCPRNVA